MKENGMRAALACLLFVVLVVAVLVIAPIGRALASPSGTLSACVNSGNGMMRLVSSSSDCHANESFVTWSITGPAGPPGPPGPPGSSAGGPPFVWVCTPANYPRSASNTDGNVYTFNGSSTTANVALHIYDKDGNNLSGVTVPGSSPPDTYPGETGSATVALNSKSTRTVHFQLPQMFLGDSHASFSVEVVSDQPITVGSDFEFSGFHALPCSLLPK